MFRRAIEIAVKTISPRRATRGDNLKKRIEDLPPDVATPAMKTLAQHVRLDANDAAHEPEEFSEDDAKKLRVFAEMFLTYAFTLPEMLKRASPAAYRSGGQPGQPLIALSLPRSLSYSGWVRGESPGVSSSR